MKFSTPPPSRAGSNFDWESATRKLRRKPHEWAEVGRMRVSTVNSARYGYVNAVKPDEYEFITRDNMRDPNDEDRLNCTLWMRYIGGKKA